MTDLTSATPALRYLTLAAFIILVLGGGTLIGLTTMLDGWYAALRKPPFNPPNWIFAPVWSALYVLIAVAGWRTWMRDRLRRHHSPAMAAWVLQLLLNFVWSPLFFVAHSPAAALIAIVALLIAIIIFIMQSWRRDRIAAWLFVPYGVWVAFATLLNGAIFALN
jgi:tryptophan-rich sensory protein